MTTPAPGPNDDALKALGAQISTLVVEIDQLKKGGGASKADLDALKAELSALREEYAAFKKTNKPPKPGAKADDDLPDPALDPEGCEGGFFHGLVD